MANRALGFFRRGLETVVDDVRFRQHGLCFLCR